MSLDIFCSHCGASNHLGAQRCFACNALLVDAGQQPDAGDDSVTATGQAAVLKQRYQLLEKVGEGGFSIVYKAEDLTTRMIVAIKAIHLQGLKVQEKIEATDAFNREVQMLTQLEHKNLPRLYDHFSDAECWYMVMDFIAGTTLEKRMERRKGTPLVLEEVFDIGLILCYVLAYLHDQRPAIIFRDLKPANIILTREGHLFLIDFGIARQYKPGQIRDTIPFGSPGYAAPEQYGKAQTTPLADIYSLGVILHQLLSGNDPSQNPFRFAPLADRHEPARAALNILIQRMVHTNPQQRPRDIAEVRRELQLISTQRASQHVLYSHKPMPTLPHTPHAIPHRPQPAQAASIWQTGVQPAVTSTTTSAQMRLLQVHAQPRQQRQQKHVGITTHANLYALASLFSGLLGIFMPLFFCGFVSTTIEAHNIAPPIVIIAVFLLIPSIMGIVFGHISRHYARAQQGKRARTDVANAGLMLGYAFSIIYLLFISFILFFH